MNGHFSEDGILRFRSIREHSPDRVRDEADDLNDSVDQTDRLGFHSGVAQIHRDETSVDCAAEEDDEIEYIKNQWVFPFLFQVHCSVSDMDFSKTPFLF